MGLLKKVGGLLEEACYMIENIDATIIAQKPKMRGYIEEMEKNIADTLGIEKNQVNVKATTEEGLGFTGSGEGISSQAICAVSSMYEHMSDNLAEPGCASCSGCKKQG